MSENYPTIHKLVNFYIFFLHVVGGGEVKKNFKYKKNIATNDDMREIDYSNIL